MRGPGASMRGGRCSRASVGLATRPISSATARAEDAAKNLVGVGIDDYRAELEAFLKTIPPLPVLLGHSMGAVLAQSLAAKGLARALVLVAPGPRAGILPQTEAAKKLGQDLMGLGAFWNTVINPDFDLARVLT